MNMGLVLRDIGYGNGNGNRVDVIGVGSDISSEDIYRKWQAI